MMLCATLNDIVPWAQLVGYLVAGIALIISALSFRRNNRVKRGEWLKALHEKFFESDIYKKVRKEIDYDRLDTFLDTDVNGDARNEDNEEKLVDYLNFFEFISVLQLRGHITKEEVNDLFGYYFGIIQSNVFLRKYFKRYGFENLTKMLNEHK